MPAKKTHHGPKITLRVSRLERGIALTFMSPRKVLTFPLRSRRSIVALVKMLTEAGRLPKPARVQAKAEDERQMPLELG